MKNRDKRHRALTTALRSLLKNIIGASPAELKKTPERVATLWLDYLLAGQNLNLAEVLGKGIKSPSRAAVGIFDVGVHLICPHHFTVAFGTATVAYIPNGYLASFGALSRLVNASTSRLVLQEEASQAIAETVVKSLDAKAAVAIISAVHPCHAILQARAHDASIVTWGESGAEPGLAKLRKFIKDQQERGRAKENGERKNG